MKDLKGTLKCNNRGITLIVLIITIIVLLILSAISIAVLTEDNGILTKAGEARETIIRENVLERVQIEVLGSYGEDGKLNNKSLEENLKNIPGIQGVPSQIEDDDFPLIVSVDGYDVEITKKGGVTLASYVRDGLILHLDGINNTGTGHHDITAQIWKDLSGNKNDVELRNFSYTTGSGWNSNGLELDGIDDGIYLGDKLIDLYKNNATIELVVNFTDNDSRDVIIGNYSVSNNINIERGSSSGSNVRYRGRIYYNAGRFDALTPNDIYEANKNLTISFLLDKNENKITFVTNSDKKENLTSNILSENYDFKNAWIGRDQRTGSTSLQGTIYSVRIYNRMLDQDELNRNYQVDKKRFSLE